MKKKSVIIGLDGASFTLLKDFFDSGSMPFLKEKMASGYYAKLQSTIPYYSAPAWTSMVTGVSPGRHSIYDFFRFDPEHGMLPVSSSARRYPAFWNILTEFGRRSIVMNVPCTYPPEEINGVMVTGMMTPSKRSGFIYPVENKEILRGYIPDSWWQALPFLAYKNRKNRAYKLTKDVVKSRFLYFKKLLLSETWDASMLVIRIIDHLQHYFWNEKELLESIYGLIDKEIKDLCSLFPGLDFYVVSDHGFRSAERNFNINNFLSNNGYIAKNPDNYLASYMKTVLSPVITVVSGILDVNRISSIQIFRKIINSAINRELEILTSSRAFCPSNSSCSIHVKDPDDIETIRDLLSELTDPVSSEKAVKCIYGIEDLYDDIEEHGSIPDLFFELSDLLTLNTRLSGKQRKGVREEFSPLCSGHTGEHAREGVFLAFGDSLKSGGSYDESFSVMDVMPTMLYGMGLGIIENVDGTVRKIFNTEYNKDSFISEFKTDPDDKELTEQDADVIKKRLRELGYL